VFFASGFFYDLESRMWLPAPLPPPQPFGIPNLISFQGKPTIFGTPLCDDGNCPFSVMQYDESVGDWVEIGLLQEERVFSLVIEVPSSFCTM